MDGAEAQKIMGQIRDLDEQVAKIMPEVRELCATQADLEVVKDMLEAGMVESHFVELPKFDDLRQHFPWTPKDEMEKCYSSALNILRQECFTSQRDAAEIAELYRDGVSSDRCNAACDRAESATVHRTTRDIARTLPCSDYGVLPHCMGYGTRRVATLT